MTAISATDDLIRRNRALLKRAEATRTYTAILREESAEEVLMAHVQRFRALCLRRRPLVLLAKVIRLLYPLIGLCLTLTACRP
jgi:hypothetical protein